MNIYKQQHWKDIIFVNDTNSMTANKNIYDTTVGENNKIYFMGSATIPSGCIVKVCENGQLIGLL